MAISVFTFEHVHVLRKPGSFEPQTGIMSVPNCKKEKRYKIQIICKNVYTPSHYVHTVLQLGEKIF